MQLDRDRLLQNVTVDKLALFRVELCADPFSVVGATAGQLRELVRS
jgi:hypothetical protein